MSTPSPIEDHLARALADVDTDTRELNVDVAYPTTSIIVSEGEEQ